MTERAEEAAQALTLALSERKLVLPVLTPVQYPPYRIDSDQVAPESPPSDRTWMLGYAVIAAGLILPTLAKLSSTFDPIKVILFYVVGVAVWGSVAAAAIVIWKKFKPNKTKIGHMSEAQIKFTCPTCSQIFSFGPQQYDGKHIIKYQLTVCASCFAANHDGWAPHLEEIVSSVLVAKAEPLPSRNEKGLLPRNGRNT